MTETKYQKNPLMRYKKKYKLSWPDLERITGVSWRTCHRLAYARPGESDNTSIGTVRKIFKTTSVNLIDWDDNE